LNKEYLGLYTHGQIINHPIDGWILYNCSLSKAFKFILGNNLKILLVEMKRATEKEIAEHIIRLKKVIHASCVKARYSKLAKQLYIDFGRF